MTSSESSRLVRVPVARLAEVRALLEAVPVKARKIVARAVVQARIAEAEHRQHEAEQKVAAVNRELDRLGAPVVQPGGHGFPYNPVGRLRALEMMALGQMVQVAHLREMGNLRGRLLKATEHLRARAQARRQKARRSR